MASVMVALDAGATTRRPSIAEWLKQREEYRRCQKQAREERAQRREQPAPAEDEDTGPLRVPRANFFANLANSFGADPF